MTKKFVVVDGYKGSRKFEFGVAWSLFVLFKNQKWFWKLIKEVVGNEQSSEIKLVCCQGAFDLCVDVFEIVSRLNAVIDEIEKIK